MITQALPVTKISINGRHYSPAGFATVVLGWGASTVGQYSAAELGERMAAQAVTLAAELGLGLVIERQ